VLQLAPSFPPPLRAASYGDPLVPRQIYLGYIICTALNMQHVTGKHGITEQDVRDAVQWPARLIRARWVDVPDDPRAPRVVAWGRTSDNRVIQVVLYPVGDPAEGTWRLGTAVVET
jgi:hypothetical protein